MVLLFVSYLIIGLIIGSFLNVCIYRLSVGRSIVTPQLPITMLGLGG